MKIYTKSVWQWIDDQLVRVDAECKSFDHAGPVDLLKGGNSGGPYYSGLEKLYDEQAKSAEFLGGIFRKDVAPGYQEWGKQIKGYGSVANQEKAASDAIRAVKEANAGQQQAYEENMASFGRDISLPEYAGAQKQAGITAAGMEAGAGTAGREQVRRQDIAQQQDWVGMGMGTPTTAAQASNSAANALNSASAGQNIYDQQQAKGVGAVAQIGTNLYGQMSDNSSGTSYGKDGGLMLKLKQGGYVNRRAAQRFATGGFARVAPITPPPPMLPKPPSPAAVIGGQSTTPLGLDMIRSGGGKAIQLAGRTLDAPQVTQFGYGLEQGPNKLAAQAKHLQEIQSTENFKAAAMVDDALNSTGMGMAPTAAPTVGGGGTASLFGAAPAAAPAAAAPAGVMGGGGGTASLFGAAPAVGETAAGISSTGLGAAGLADTALAAGATEAVAGGTAAASGGLSAGAMGAGAALGSAMPVIGAGLAAYAIGSQLGWWKDGGAVGQQGLSRGGDDGSVTPGSVQDTGEVDGPGGPKDDMINAQLSDGEYVFPKGAVMFYGLDKLDKMRQKGLEYEKQMGIA